MEYLFNSRGQHIANFIGKQLHAPTGENIGHYLSDQGFFIDTSGGLSLVKTSCTRRMNDFERA
jgi:hypothetical protein